MQEYKAFISYSRASDVGLAQTLKRALERCGKPWIRARNFRVFRDESSLSATSELVATIQGALDRSEYFVLMASTEAAGSNWVAREIEHWCESRDTRNFIIALTEGEIAWDDPAGDFCWRRTTALPRGLAGKFQSEPLFVDLRGLNEGRRRLDKSDFSDRVETIAATLHGVSKEMMNARARWEDKKAMRIVAGVSLALVLLVAWALISRHNQFIASNIATQRQLAEKSQEFISKEPTYALSTAIQAVRTGLDAGLPIVPAAESALHKALGETGGDPVFRLGASRTVERFVVGPGGLLVTYEGEGHAPILRNLGTPSGPGVALTPTPGSLGSLELHPDGRHLAGHDSSSGVVWLWDLERPNRQARSLGHPTRWQGDFLFHPDGHRLVTMGSEGPEPGRPERWSTFEIWKLDEDEGPKVIPSGAAPAKAYFVHPDGRSLLTVATRLLGNPGGPVETVVLSWDIEHPEARPITVATLAGDYRSAAMEPGGRRLAIHAGRTIRVEDLGQPVAGPVECTFEEMNTSELAFQSGGKRLICVTTSPSPDGARVSVRASGWDFETPGTSFASLGEVDVAAAGGVVLAPGARFLAVSEFRAGDRSAARDVALVNLARPLGGVAVHLKGHAGHIAHLAFWADGHQLYSSDDRGEIRRWSVDRAETEPLVLRGNPWPIQLVPQGAMLRPRLAFKEFLVAMSADPKGGRIATADARGGVEVWDLDPPGPVPVASLYPRQWDDSSGPMRSLTFLEGSQSLLVAGGRVILWEFGPGSRKPVSFGDEAYSAGPDYFASKRVATDGRWLATISGPPQGGRILLQDLQHPYRPPEELAPTPTPPSFLAVDPDGHRLIATGGPPPGGDAWLCVYKLLEDPKSSPARFLFQGGWIGRIEISPGGRWMIAGPGNVQADPSKVELLRFDLKDPSAKPVPFVVEASLTACMAFHPDGRGFFIHNVKGDLFRFDLEDLARGPELAFRFLKPVGWLEFRRDGLLASYHPGGGISLTYLVGGKSESVVLTESNPSVVGLCFDRDGRRLVTADRDGFIRIWTVDVQSLLRMARERAREDLAPAP